MTAHYFQLLGLAIVIGTAVPQARAAAVWRATAPGGGTVYLGGSVHALRSVDYPLPAAFNRAFDLSSRIVFEVDAKEMARVSKSIDESAAYGKGDSLKNHVDPRTYDYLKRVFALARVPEAKFSRYRPWFLALMLQSQGGNRDFVGALGVEEFLTKRARANAKPILGLESAREHAAVFSGLNERQSEAMLLITFIPRANPASSSTMMSAWRRGDSEALWRMTHDGFRDYPVLGDRVLEARNRAWVPQIERFAASGTTHFVVVGAAHMGGPEGLLNLLRNRNYRIEQL